MLYTLSHAINHLLNDGCEQQLFFFLCWSLLKWCLFQKMENLLIHHPGPHKRIWLLFRSGTNRALRYGLRENLPFVVRPIFKFQPMGVQAPNHRPGRASFHFSAKMCGLVVFCYERDKDDCYQNWMGFPAGAIQKRRPRPGLVKTTMWLQMGSYIFFAFFQ